jgi:hypothetical protein
MRTIKLNVKKKKKKKKWTSRWFRDSNQLMELAFRAFSSSRSDNEINWLLLIWSQVNDTPFIANEEIPCRKDAVCVCQMEKKGLLSEMGKQTESPQMTKLYAQQIMKNARKLHIRQVQRTLYVKGWKEWLGRMCLSTSHLFTKLHLKEAGPL